MVLLFCDLSAQPNICTVLLVSLTSECHSHSLENEIQLIVMTLPITNAGLPHIFTNHIPYFFNTFSKPNLRIQYHYFCSVLEILGYETKFYTLHNAP